MVSDEKNTGGMRVMRAPNHRLSSLIDQAGLSNKQLARAVRETAARYGTNARCTHTSVQRWRDGRRSRAVPPALIAETLSLALGRVVTPADIGMPAEGRPRSPMDTRFIEAPEELAAAACRLWEADLDRSDVIHAELPIGLLSGPALHWLLAQELPMAAGNGPGPEVTSADLGRLRATLEAFEPITARHGGAVAHRPVVQYLHSDLGRLLTGRYPEDVGRALAGIATQGLLLAGACAHEAGLAGLGRRYHLLALFFAHQADARALGGRALVALAGSCDGPGDQPAVLDLLRAAALGTHAESGAVRVSVHVAEAWAYAILRDATGADRALAQARRAATEEVAGPSDGSVDAGNRTIPAWAARDIAEAELRCRVALGDHAGAQQRAYEVLAALGPGDTVRTVLAQALLATAQLRGGLVDQACDAGERAVALSAGLQSASVDRRLDRLADELAALPDGGRPAALAKLIREQLHQRAPRRRSVDH